MLSLKGFASFFFFTHAITILSFFTYSVCDEKVKIQLDSIDSVTCRDSSKVVTVSLFSNYHSLLTYSVNYSAFVILVHCINLLTMKHSNIC